MSGLRERLVLAAGEAALPGFRERAAVFGAAKTDRLALFNSVLALARGAYPDFDRACAGAGLGPAGCASLAGVSGVPALDRAALASGRKPAAGTAVARLESGGTGRSGRLRTALALSGVVARYADLLAVLRETGWRMGERVTALHPEEYGYFQNFAANLRAGEFGKLGFEFFQQYLLYRAVHNRRNVHYSGDIFQSPEAARALLESAVADDPVLLISRPDALMAVLKAWRPGDRFRRLRAVLTVGTALGSSVRAAAAARFGAAVFDMYASTELGYVGLTCPLSEGRFHLNQAAYIVENGPGGSVIVSDLDNRLTPMPRYDTGDIGALEPGPCACGRPGPLLRFIGRRAGAVEAAGGRRLRETDIIDGAFPEDLPFFQLVRDGEGLELLLPRREAPRAAELAGKVGTLLGLPAAPVPVPGGLRLPPSGKFCYLP